MSPSNRAAAAKLVEDVLSGVIRTYAEFQRRIEGIHIEQNSELALNLHQVQHYVADADIRERDPEYAKIQTQELREILQRLRADQNEPEAEATEKHPGFSLFRLSKKELYAVLPFAAYGLIGPAIAFYHLWRELLPMPLFAYSLIAALWPWWGMAAYESVVGTFWAATYAVLLNVCTFGLVGWVAIAVAGNRRGLLALFIAVVMGQAVFFSRNWGQFEVLTVAVVSILLAVPFAILARLRDKQTLRP
jgi:hypothetical protein